MIFSIIIPAKNEEKNIDSCLRALSCQDTSSNSYELIVVDNGSTDGTVAVVDAYDCSCYVKPGLSLSELRNFGASVSSGEVLVFLDADCVPDKDWLKNIIRTLADPEVGCTGSTPVAPPEGPWVEQVWSSFRTRRKNKLFTSWINSSNFIVRKPFFEAVGGFNDRVKTCEDVDICMRLGKVCKILFDPTIKVVHLGEPKTIKSFFLKEVWRGKGTISGIISHGFNVSELKSLVIPVYYLFSIILIVASLMMKSFIVFFVSLVFVIIPALIFSIKIVIITGKYNYFLGYFVLFLVYANARMISLLLR